VSSEPKKSHYQNRLNDLSNHDWLLFQKSWFVHNPPRRKKGVLAHPAKFPETLVREFVEFFTKEGQWVLDPMVGTGSTCLACLQCGRNSVGVDLMEKYLRIAQEWVDSYRVDHPTEVEARLIAADSRELSKLDLPEFDYCITSPPYWDMLKMRGFETQKKRRESDELDLNYSDDERDVGNLEDYNRFLEELVAIYREVHEVLKPRGYLTVIVKNVKKAGKHYPLAWDLGRRLGEFFALKDEKIWLQDNQKLAPYGMGNAWVSNTMHHYCLQFRKE